MLKKEITYTNYDGVEVTETFYFNLNKAELFEMEASEGGGYSDKLKRISENKDVPLMMQTFKSLILKSVGIKSEDGKFFRKPAGYAEDFESSEAYSVLFSELLTNAEAAAAFVSGILPLSNEQRNDLMNQAKAAIPEKTE